MKTFKLLFIITAVFSLLFNSEVQAQSNGSLDHDDYKLINSQSSNYYRPPISPLYQPQENYLEPPVTLQNLKKKHLPPHEWGFTFGWGGGGDDTSGIFGGGLGFSYLYQRRWGFDVFFRGYGNTEYNDRRELLTFGFNLIYYFSQVEDGDFVPYLKGGAMLKYTNYYHEGTYEDTLYREEDSHNLFFAGGLHYRLPFVALDTFTWSLNLEGTLITANADESDDGKSSTFLIHFFFGFHF